MNGFANRIGGAVMRDVAACVVAATLGLVAVTASASAQDESVQRLGATGQTVLVERPGARRTELSQLIRVDRATGDMLGRFDIVRQASLLGKRIDPYRQPEVVSCGPDTWLAVDFLEGRNGERLLYRIHGQEGPDQVQAMSINDLTLSDNGCSADGRVFLQTRNPVRPRSQYTFYAVGPDMRRRELGLGEAMVPLRDGVVLARTVPGRNPYQVATAYRSRQPAKLVAINRDAGAGGWSGRMLYAVAGKRIYALQSPRSGGYRMMPIRGDGRSFRLPYGFGRQQAFGVRCGALLRWGASRLREFGSKRAAVRFGFPAYPQPDDTTLTSMLGRRLLVYQGCGARAGTVTGRVAINGLPDGPLETKAIGALSLLDLSPSP